MTEPKVGTIKRGGARLYIDPVNPGTKYPGVTSVLSMLPKEFLKYWAQKVVAECAVDELGTVVQMTLRDREAAIDHLKRAPDRITRTSANIGTEAHSLFERMAKGEAVGRVHPDLEPYKAHIAEFLNSEQPEFLYMEETVWSDTHKYAGSFDWLARIRGELVWGDTKTTKSGIHEEVGVQLAAYSHADCIISPSGERIPLPQADGAAVFHVRPEGWSLVPVRADRVLFEEVFLPLRKVFDYEKELKRTVIGHPVASGPSGAIAAPKRRAPRVTPKAAA